MKRHEVQEMVCTQCDTRQPMQQDCAHCGSRLGKYYCDVCRLHDDEEKGQYHCTECGICRSGGRDKFFHCAECDLCLPNIMQNNHKCLKGVGRSDCGVCLEDIHSARSGGQVLPCGHLLHVHCYKEMVQHRLNTCPKCKVSIKNRKLEWARMDKAIRHSIVPAEYRHTYINVLCCDCHSTGPTKYHIIGLKCRECGSYNTSPAGPLERRDSKGERL
ncbi:RING finger and CHY zinc finger domain-containing protein 1 [Amphibalanus amphitrite]|uniref:RING finger and CHY zinc finger domain-containing protein 1 n=1 Tax=Amphibalanus amphitrite TaxID=1232801 RepID=A0A6A4WJN1_AMPAM|nr:RING finger and CHY zinc finger domain-containing protein 1 [Amphibalanus amphitrite]